MPSTKLSDRLKQLVLELSCNPDELYRYSRNPAAYLRKKRFSGRVIDVITAGSRALQPLLAERSGAAPGVFLVIGVKGFRSFGAKGARKKKRAS